MSTPESSSPVTLVGVDVAKDSAVVFLLPEGRLFTPGRPADLVKELTGRGPCLVVLEATGGYERPWVAALSDAGIPVAVVNPKRVRDFAKAMGYLAKTDRIDARIIAEYASKPLASQPKCGSRPALASY